MMIKVLDGRFSVILLNISFIDENLVVVVMYLLRDGLMLRDECVRVRIKWCALLIISFSFLAMSSFDAGVTREGSWAGSKLLLALILIS